MSGILICAQQKGTAWAEVKPRAYKSTHLALDLHRTNQSDANSNQEGVHTRFSHLRLTISDQQLSEVAC